MYTIVYGKFLDEKWSYSWV